MPDRPSLQPRERRALASPELWIIVASVIVLIAVNAWVAVGEMTRVDRERSLEDHIRRVQARLERAVLMEASAPGSGDPLDRLSADARAFRRAATAPIGAALSSNRDEALTVIQTQITTTAQAVQTYRRSPQPASRAAMLAAGTQATDRLDALLRELAAQSGQAAPGAMGLLPVVTVNLLLLALAALGLRGYTSSLLDGRTSHDGLTGVPNRRMFQEALMHEAARAERYQRPLSLLVMDVDGMRAINRGLGPKGGDRVLRRLGERFAEALRAGDGLFRIEGQQFAVLAPETGIHQARTLAERLREAAGALEEDVVTVSIGAAEQLPGERPRDLYARCRAALRQAKAGGGNRFQPDLPAGDRATGTG